MISYIANCLTIPQLETATVVQQIGPDQPGRVEYQASYWSAKLSPDAGQLVLHPKTEVVVVARQGITLLVAPQETLISDRQQTLEPQQGFFSLARLFASTKAGRTSC